MLNLMQKEQNQKEKPVNKSQEVRDEARRFIAEESGSYGNQVSYGSPPKLSNQKKKVVNDPLLGNMRDLRAVREELGLNHVKQGKLESMKF